MLIEKNEKSVNVIYLIYNRYYVQPLSVDDNNPTRECWNGTMWSRWGKEDSTVTVCHAVSVIFHFLKISSNTNLKPHTSTKSLFVALWRETSSLREGD
jgi:hypothetical protein